MLVVSYLFLISSPILILADGVSPSEARVLRDEVRAMFYHAFDGYMQHAFPLDELRPLTCKGEDSLGGYALTLGIVNSLVQLLNGLVKMSALILTKPFQYLRRQSGFLVVYSQLISLLAIMPRA